MARAFILFEKSATLPVPLYGALQLVGILAIVVTTLGVVALSAS